MPASLSHRADAPITLQAKSDANAAISTGRLYVGDAGTIATYTPGVAPAQAPLIRNLPHRMLSGGCTDPTAVQSALYAATFNAEIVRHLLERVRE